MPLKNELVFWGFAPLFLPIALHLGLRGKPWTKQNVQAEIVRFHDSYTIACSRSTR